MGRLGKLKHAEKSKTKLKGAKLTKGDNVTKTDFKVRKIVLPEQLKERKLGEVLSSTKKINVKECLTRLQQPNSGSRTEGLKNLKEIITKHPDDMVSNHMGTVIKSVATMIVDIEKSVRKEAFSTLTIILSSSRVETIRPFFDVISSHLRCAMTHINPSIQTDSLLALDIVATHIPVLLAEDKDKIFSHFLDMISRMRSESQPGRTLTVNMSQKTTTVKWRNQVLERLQKMMNAIIDEKKQSRLSRVMGATNAAESLLEDAFALEPVAKKSRPTFSPSAPMYFPIVRSTLNRVCSIPSLFHKTIGSKGGADALVGHNDEEKKLKTYAQQLMPLMYETWLEVRPQGERQQQANDSAILAGTFISNEAAYSLKLLLTTVAQLWELMVLWNQEVNNDDLTEWFAQEYARDFNDHLISTFPYSQGESGDGVSKHKAKRGLVTQKDVEQAGGVKCWQQNLNISFMFCCINKELLTANDKSYGSKVVRYLDQSVQSWNFRNVELTNQLLKVVRCVLFKTTESWVTDDSKALLQSVIGAYMHEKTSREAKTKILVFLCDFILNVELVKKYGVDLFLDWIRQLPDLLVQKEINHDILMAFSCLGKQGNKVFLRHLEAKAADIIANLPTIKVTNIDDQFAGQQQIANLFYWLDKNKIETLLTNVRSNDQRLDRPIFNYLTQTLMIKVQQ